MMLLQVGCQIYNPVDVLSRQPQNNIAIATGPAAGITRNVVVIKMQDFPPAGWRSAAYLTKIWARSAHRLFLRGEIFRSARCCPFRRTYILSGVCFALAVTSCLSVTLSYRAFHSTIARRSFIRRDRIAKSSPSKVVRATPAASAVFT